MRVSDFDYVLPDELIATHPAPERTGSRLLTLDRSTGQIADKLFPELLSLLTKDDLLVFNNTRVVPARLHGAKSTGGKVEILIERILGSQTALAHIKASKAPKPGSRILLEHGFQIDVTGRSEALFEIKSTEEPLADILKQVGHMPLPPYIRREDTEEDKERYQTIYGAVEGAVAAPTAGLHFDQILLDRIQSAGIDTATVTLHVGAGTFQPVRAECISEHKMHSEWIEVSESVCEKVAAAKARGGRVIAVGTTSVRSLEAANRQSYTGDTDIFIYPGYVFNTVDAMITNFHLPKSTLLMLVSAFAGKEKIECAYHHAIRQAYRFFSYGDAMFIY